MQNELKKIESLIKEAKSIDSKTLKVDQEFKESLREELYNNYLNQVTKEVSIMEKIKTIALNRRFALLSVGVIAFVAILAGSGVFLLTRRGGESDGEETKEVLLAANLAVADGEVEVKKSGDDRWMEAKQGDTLSQGDSLKTGEDSRAVLEIDNGDAVRLNASSAITLENMDPSDVVVDQEDGETYSRVASSEENTYTIKGQGVTAQAMGTAYTFNSDIKEQEVTVSVYESEVKVNYENEENDLKLLEKAVIDVEKKKVEIKDVTEKEYKKDFVKWNQEQDEELGYEIAATGPSASITSPKDGAKTEDDKITVKGTVTKASSGYALRKIKVNGKIHTEMKDGKGFDPATGKFNVSVSLNYGKNTIKVQAYDIYWNAGKAVSVNVTREGEEPAPAPTNSFYISNIYSPADGKIYVSWVNTLGAPDGYKLVYAKSPTVPAYPGSDFKYLSETSTTITGLSAGTYNVRVCIYHPNDSVKCPTYTPMKTITIEGEVKGETTYPTGVNISVGNPVAYEGKYKVKVTWSPVGSEAPNGYKVCWATHSNPKYPDDTCQYVSSSTKSLYVTGLECGTTYHFRVGVYKKEGGSCVLYSADVSKTMP